jgi:hypothetical protein
MGPRVIEGEVYTVCFCAVLLWRGGQFGQGGKGVEAFVVHTSLDEKALVFWMKISFAYLDSLKKQFKRGKNQNKYCPNVVIHPVPHTLESWAIVVVFRWRVQCINSPRNYR